MTSNEIENLTNANTGTKLTLIERVYAIEMMAELVKDGKEIEAMGMTNYFEEQTGKRINWHEFANYLDYLNRKGFLAHARCNFGRNYYTIEIS